MQQLPLPRALFTLATTDPAWVTTDPGWVHRTACRWVVIDNARAHYTVLEVAVSKQITAHPQPNLKHLNKFFENKQMLPSDTASSFARRG